MIVPTSIPETPMAQPDSESLQESKDTDSHRSMEVLQHVLPKVLDIKDDEENKSSQRGLKTEDMTTILISVADFCHILMTTVCSEQMTLLDYSCVRCIINVGLNGIRNSKDGIARRKVIELFKLK